MLRPPLVPGGGGRHCHSLVNRTDDPTVFVVQVSSLHLPKRLCNISTAHSCLPLPGSVILARP